MGKVFEGVIPRGEERRWEANENFFVHAGRAHGLRYSFQGKPLGDNGLLGDPIKVLRFQASRQGVFLVDSGLQPLSEVPVIESDLEVSTVLFEASVMETDSAPSEIVSGSFSEQPLSTLEKPATSDMVYVADYDIRIDKYEVTNERFAEFLNARGNQREGGVEWLLIDSDGDIEQQEDAFSVKEGYEDYPVTRVTWYGAKAYCAWVEKRLPTDEEWEQACQGKDGRMYPWGNSEPSSSLANYRGTDDGYKRIAPVGSFPWGASLDGMLDMAGNASEWTSSARGDFRVLRGGSWSSGSADLRCAKNITYRPLIQSTTVGFRCVR